MGKKRSRHPVVDEEEERMAMDEAEELELEIRARREILREKVQAGTATPEDLAALMGGGDDSDDDEDGERAPPTRPVNNEKGLEQALKEVMAKNGARPWPETLDICKFELDAFDGHDDIKREMAFYKNALSGVKEARELLAKHKVPYKRPEDFFCDMLKSDDHMARIKDRLIFEQKKIAAVEERRQQQENRKFSKALKTNRASEKTEEKKRTLDAVKQWKKAKAQRSGQGLLPDNDGLDEVLDGKGDQQGGRRGSRGGDGGANKKRMGKDKKYGFGGTPKRLLKQTDKKSLNDFSDFNPKRGKAVGGKKGKGANRPGKTARLKTRLNKKK